MTLLNKLIRCPAEYLRHFRYVIASLGWYLICFPIPCASLNRKYDIKAWLDSWLNVFGKNTSSVMLCYTLDPIQDISYPVVLLVLSLPITVRQEVLHLLFVRFSLLLCIMTWSHSHTSVTSTGFSSVQSLSHAQLFATPWPAAHQASLSFTNSQNVLKLMSTESVMPSNHFILCHPLLLLPSTFPSIRVFSNESVLH